MKGCIHICLYYSVISTPSHWLVFFCASGGHFFCTAASLDIQSVLLVRSAAVGGHESTPRSLRWAAEEGYLQWKVRGAHHYPAPRVSFEITIWISLLECATGAWSINICGRWGPYRRASPSAPQGIAVKKKKFMKNGSWKCDIYASSAYWDQCNEST